MKWTSVRRRRSITAAVLMILSCCALAPRAWAREYFGYPAVGTLSGDEILGPIRQNGSDKTINLGTLVGGAPFTATGSTMARTEASRWAHVANVKDFGAKGDCSTDDTGAINAAISAASSVLYSTYWNPVLTAAVYFPPGCYMTGGNDLSSAVSVYGDGPNLVTLALKNGSNRSVLRVLPDAQGDPSPWAQHMQGLIRGLTIQGNGNNQTAGDGIEYQDAGYNLGTRYATAGRVEDVHIFGAYNDGIYAGSNRNFGFINNVIIQYTNVGAAVELFSSQDWLVSNFSLGEAHGAGLKVSYANDNTFTNGAIYGNGDSGVIIQQAGGYTYISNTQVAGNQQYGVYYKPGASAGENSLHLANMQIGNNSLASNGTYAQIFAQNYESLDLSNIFFIYAGGNNASYLVDADTTGYVNVSNINYSMSAGTTAGSAPYTVAPFHYLDRVIGNTGRSPGFIDNSSSVYVNSSTQYRGFAVKNGANTVASLEGTTASNDAGALTLYNSGTSQVNLSSSGQSTISQGLTVGNNLKLPSYTFSALPTTHSAGAFVYCSDCLKPGESASAGTGMTVFDDGTNWVSTAGTVAVH